MSAHTHQRTYIHAHTLLAVLLLTTVCSLLSALTMFFSLLSFLSSLHSSCFPRLPNIVFLINYFIHPLFILTLISLNFNMIYPTQTIYLFMVAFRSNLFILYFLNDCPQLQYGLSRTLILYPIWFVLHPSFPQHSIWFVSVYRWLLYGTAWQGTDLMHNHVLADTSLTVAGFPGNLPCSDQSEDSDYDSIWTAHSYRTASFSRKILVS